MSETEPKTAGKGVLIALAITSIVLAACLGAVITAYTLMINDKNNTITSLNYQISQLNSTVTNLQKQLNLNVSVANYTVVGTLSYANVSAIYTGILVENINPNFGSNLVGSFMFLTFNGQLSSMFPAGFVAGNVVVVNGTISFDEHSQTYFLNWINGSLYNVTVNGINEQLGLQMTLQKTNYSLGEPINITLTLTNISNQTATIGLSAYNNFDFQVYNDTNSILYQWSNRWIGVAVPQVIVLETLNPGESLSQNFVWNQTCHNNGLSEGVPISPGIYYIVGQIGSVLSGKNSTIETTPIQITID